MAPNKRNPTSPLRSCEVKEGFIKWIWSADPLSCSKSKWALKEYSPSDANWADSPAGCPARGVASVLIQLRFLPRSLPVIVNKTTRVRERESLFVLKSGRAWELSEIEWRSRLVGPRGTQPNPRERHSNTEHHADATQPTQLTSSSLVRFRTRTGKGCACCSFCRHERRRPGHGPHSSIAA